jgi:hypothetical protein
MAAERVERRLAAILAADVAGYSRLMGADEEGTLAALKAICRECLNAQPQFGLRLDDKWPGVVLAQSAGPGDRWAEGISGDDRNASLPPLVRKRSARPDCPRNRALPYSAAFLRP